MLILLATWSVAGGIVTCQIGQGKLIVAKRPPSAKATLFSPTAHSSQPIADDGLTHFSAKLQPIEVFPFPFFPLTSTPITEPRIERDLLSLTQRRRE